MELGDIDKLIEQILPIKDDKYDIDEIDRAIGLQRDRLELEQRKYNDLFDKALDPETIGHLQSQHDRMSKLQPAISKLRCDVSNIRAQYCIVESIKENPIIKKHYDMLSEEQELKQSLQRLKFKPIVDFFELYTGHLEQSVLNSRVLRSRQAATTIYQLFDWTQYHHIVLLLRACGKAIMDIDRFERLYQSNSNISLIKFKQPLESIHFENFIEFYHTFALETLLVITTEQGTNEPIDQLLSNLESDDKTSEHQLLGPIRIRLKFATEECCKLLLDINMSYIEAHLTDGINVDKLNGTEDGIFSPQEDNSLPLYALSPQEYITQIGQHLLTLRKHTEQFDVDENEPLKLGLLKLRQAQDIPIDVNSYKTVTEIVMRCIARHCIQSLLGRTSNSILSKLTLRGRRQLATDTLYLDNVLEDLKLLDPSEPNTVKFKSLLSQ